MPLYFRVTDAGLAAATDAAALGLRLAITRFKLGSSYGYSPTGTETSLAGTIVYDEPISSYKNMPDGSMIFVCSVLPSAGPFNFGEIGIFTDAGVLFAVATFPDLQEKYVSTGSSVNSTFTFNCHMNLTQRATTFDLSAASVPDAQIYMRWDQIVAQSSMPDPRVLRIVINEPDSRGDFPTLSGTTSGGWAIDGVMFNLNGAVSPLASTTTYFDISKDTWSAMIPGAVAATVQDVINSATIVIQVNSTTFRKATPSIVGNNVRLTYTVALSSAAGVVRMFINDTELTNTKSYLEQAITGMVTPIMTSTQQALTLPSNTVFPNLVESRAAVLNVQTSLAIPPTTLSLYAPPGITKEYVVLNNTVHSLSVFNSTVAGNTTAAGVGVTIPAGKTAAIWTDGTNFSLQNTYLNAPTIVNPFMTGGTSDNLYLTNTTIGSGTISGITDLAVADGGTGASNATNARANLGLTIGTNVLAPNGDGSALTNLNASALASGTVPVQRSGSLRVMNKVLVYSGAPTNNAVLSINIFPSYFGGVTPSFVMYSAKALISGVSDLRYFRMYAGNSTALSDLIMGSASDDTDQGGTGEGCAASTFVLPYALTQDFFCLLYGASLTIHAVGYQV